MIKKTLKRIAAGVTLILTISQLNSYAAEPLCWERTPNRPAPAQFDTYHGETLEFRCTFTGFGELPFAGADDVRLWYQTNGMGKAWWSIPATVSSNVLEAAWGPSCDPGAERLSVFFGAPSNAYAAAQVRFRNSPGAHPNVLEPPSVLDWQAELAAATNEVLQAAFAADLTTNDVRAIAATVSPPVDLSPATNYVNDLRRLISDGLLKAGTAGQADRAYEADTASSASRAEMADLAMNAMGADNATWADHAYYLDDGTYQLTATDLMNAIPDANNFATKSALAAVSNQAQVVYRLFSSSNVVLEVTNYNSIANSPKLRLLQLTESNTYEVVWMETNNIEKALLTATNFAATASATARSEAIAASAPRAWSSVTSGMGAEAPSNTTWLSTPVTVIAGGYEYEKHVTSNGAIWLLSSKGSTWDFSPSTNNTSYLNIAASDGTPIFKIEKTDSYLLPVHADAVSVDGSALVVDFDLVSATQPFARVCTDLSAHDWAKEEDGIPAALSTVMWTPTGSGWRCRISNNAGSSSLFGYFEYLQEGGVKIVNGGVTDISGGIMVNGVKYSTIGTATVTDKNGTDRTVLTLGN